MSKLNVYGTELSSRFFLGSAGYPSPQVLREAIAASGAQVVTVALRRTLAAAGDNGFVQVVSVKLCKSASWVKVDAVCAVGAA
jgi:thiazole synthase